MYIRYKHSIQKQKGNFKKFLPLEKKHPHLEEIRPKHTTAWVNYLLKNCTPVNMHKILGITKQMPYLSHDWLLSAITIIDNYFM